MQVESISIKKVKSNPNNPRLIKDDKFEKLVNSIKEFPEMLNIRPIVVNKDMIVLGGNMRLKACIEAGLKQVPVIIVDLTEEQQKEFIIKDNVSGGEWDWSMLANEWDSEQLTEWGLDIPNFKVDEVDDLSSDIKSLYKIEISFKDEESQEIGYDKLLEQGYECRLLTL
jgi:ParB-like chromosome segregation protein Spo0J